MKIMVHIKNVPADAKALAIAVKHASAFDGAITLVSAIENQSSTPQEVVDKVKDQMEKMAAQTRENHNVPCSSEVVLTTLPIGEALVRWAQKHQADEIIMPLKRRSKLGKLFFGSNTQYVILEAPCQVITVKDD